jgi:hypothetical protein
MLLRANLVCCASLSLVGKSGTWDRIDEEFDDGGGSGIAHDNNARRIWTKVPHMVEWAGEGGWQAEMNRKMGWRAMPRSVQVELI